MRKDIRRFLFLLLGLVAGPFVAWGEGGIIFRWKEVEHALPAQDIDGRLYVDLVTLSTVLGAAPQEGLYEWRLRWRQRTVILRPGQREIFVLSKGGSTDKPKAIPIPDLLVFINGRAYGTLECLPKIFNQRFTFHLQRRTLELAQKTGATSPSLAGRSVRVKSVVRDGKTWVSLLDVARSLDIPVHSQGARRYLLVMPDFTIINLLVEDEWIYRRQERYRPMADPLYLSGGIPFVSLASLSALFGADPTWDNDRRLLTWPADFKWGRGGVDLPEVPLAYTGYRPQPLRAQLDFLSLYDQNPAPSYSSPHDEPYESVRDFYTNLPRPRDVSGWDRVSGAARASLEGSMFGQPLTGGMNIEKTATQTRLANGNITWGFPRFEVSGGREYLTPGDFSNQSGLVSYASLRHSNDAYGENNVHPEMETSVLYGEHEFLIFLSTAYFSQSVRVRQQFEGVRWGWENRWGAQQRLRMWTSYQWFTNKPLETLTTFNYLNDVLGLDINIPVSPGESTALTESVLSRRHGLTLGEIRYDSAGGIGLAVTGGYSQGEGSPSNGGDRLTGTSWKTRGNLGNSRAKMDVGYERVSPQYLSLGDPLRYQNRSVGGGNGFWELRPGWRMYGNFRREISRIRNELVLPGYRFDYGSLGQQLNGAHWSNRTLGSVYDHSLYGKKWRVDNDTSWVFGRPTLDAGGSWSRQWYSTGGLYRQSMAGRLGGSFRDGDVRWSLGEESIRHHYPLFGLHRWESVTRLTRDSAQWKGLAQYTTAPRSALESTTLHTGYFRLDRRWGKAGGLGIFFSTVSRKASLSHSDVWRGGFEYTHNLF